MLYTVSPFVVDVNDVYKTVRISVTCNYYLADQAETSSNSSNKVVSPDVHRDQCDLECNTTGVVACCFDSVELLRFANLNINVNRCDVRCSRCKSNA